MKLFFLLLFPAVVLFSGCTSFYGLPSYTDPDFRGKSYHSLLITINSSDYLLRKDFESKVVDLLHDDGIVATEGALILSPTREWNDEERRREIQKYTIDGMIVVSLMNQDTSVEHVPLQSETTRREKPIVRQMPVRDTSSRSGYRYIDSVVGYKEISNTTVSGGYVARHVQEHFKIELVDVATNRIAWVAQYSARNDHNYVPTLARNIVAQLERDSLVKK